MGKAPLPAALAVDDTLVLFSEARGMARRAFAGFVAEGAGIELPEARQQLFLGDDKFAQRMASRVRAPSREVPRKQRVHMSLTQYERAAADRDGAIQAA